MTDNIKITITKTQEAIIPLAKLRELMGDESLEDLHLNAMLSQTAPPMPLQRLLVDMAKIPSKQTVTAERHNEEVADGVRHLSDEEDREPNTVRFVHEVRRDWVFDADELRQLAGQPDADLKSLAAAIVGVPGTDHPSQDLDSIFEDGEGEPANEAIMKRTAELYFTPRP